MEESTYTQLQAALTQYLAEQNLRQTEERQMILRCICDFSGHFDIGVLQDKLVEINFHVSKSTLYYTLELLIAGGFIVRHQLTAQSAQYELRILAESHIHLVCTQCGALSEIEENDMLRNLNNLKIRRFTQAYRMLYIYGICSKCKFRLQQKKRNKY